MEELKRRITLRASESFHKRVRVRAAEVGRPIAEIVRELLELWLDGKIALDAALDEHPDG